MTVWKSISSIHPFSSSRRPRPSVFTPRTQFYPRTGFYRVRVDVGPVSTDMGPASSDVGPIRADVGRVRANVEFFIFKNFFPVSRRVVIPGVRRPFGGRTRRAGRRAALSITPYMNRAGYYRQRNYCSKFTLL
jgi:hypothetical protein